jgi:polysaccharide chain length determinant protein (PEP-CTERM system associated)
MPPISISTNSIPIQDYIDIVLRHKWWIIFAFIIGTTVAGIFSYLLPPLYRSSTLILVEPQKIPIAYVNPTVTGTVQERLSTITQQILSRTNLEKIIAQYHLYQDDLKNSGWLSKLIRLIHRRTNADLREPLPALTLQTEAASVPMEVKVERMRKQIDIKVVGGGNAFTISYTGDRPVTVMNVTNTLASLFIDENLKIREQQAEGTSEFLENQLAEAQSQLAQQEQALKNFKEKHKGALPGQLEANLRTLDRLQLELQSINDALRNAEERKISLERFRKEIRNIDEVLKSLDGATRTGQSGTDSDRLNPKLSQLKQDLARLQAQYKDNYPDIAILKNQIREVEEQMAGTEAPQAAGSFSGPRGRGDLRDLHELNLNSTALMALNSEIMSLKSRRDTTVALIKDYEARVENTFANEQNLMNLTRDYETSQRNYQGLLDKRLHAKIAENLEKRQKGEQFRVLDPANLPQKPFKPNRPKIILLGSLVTTGLCLGIILFKESLALSYSKPEDFQKTTDLPVLAIIPGDKMLDKKHYSFMNLQKVDPITVEQYRMLYTRINKLPYAGSRIVLAITSAMKGEGKTMTALNLAIVMARDFDKKTLLIEGDLKNPALATYLKQQPEVDLIDLVLSNVDYSSVVLTLGYENLAVLLLRKSVKNSLAILSSQAMKNLISRCRERYDFIIIDCPPILYLPDMDILEGLADGIILVVRAEQTQRRAVMTAMESLAREKIVGIVLNDVKSGRAYRRNYAYGKA